MKILVDASPDYPEIEIVIKCPAYTEEVTKILACLKHPETKIPGRKGEQTYLIAPKEILYLESVDKRCFFYTGGSTYETVCRLYELEQLLTPHGFIRVAKATIVNVSKINSISKKPGATLELQICSGERLTVSRQYAPCLKERLGL